MTVGKTVPELTAETPPIVGTDEVVVYRSPGPLKRTTAATVRTYMQSNLGTMATQNANAVAITGGSITGITDLAVADGGTGAGTADGALTNLGGTTVGKAVFTAANAAAARTATGTVIGTDVQAYDPDLTTWAGITPGTGVGTALAVNVGSAGAFTTFNGAGGTPSSLTLTNATGLPISGLVSSTSTALGVGSLELGNASDTTLARSSAGNMTIEGNLVYRAGGTDVPITDGGTGSSTAADARTALAVVGTVDLAASTGAALVGSINTLTGSVARTVQSSQRDRVSLRDLGCLVDGSTDDTTAFNAAITNAVATKRTLVLPAGATMKINGAITNTATWVSIEGEPGSEIDLSGGGTIILGPGPTLIGDLSTNIVAGTNTLTFSAAHGLVEGDVVLVWNPTDYTQSPFSASDHAGKMFQVAEVVSSTVVRYYGTARKNFTAADVDVYKLTAAGCHLSGFTMNPYSVGITLQVDGFNGVTLDDIRVRPSAPGTAIDIYRCYDIQVNRPRSKMLTGTGSQYPIIFANSQKIVVGSPTGLYSKRHCIGFGGRSGNATVPTSDAIVYGAILETISSNGIGSADIHGGCEDITYDNCSLEGAMLAGRNATYRNCTIYGREITAYPDGACMVGEQVVGGVYTIENCRFVTFGNTNSFGLIYIDASVRTEDLTVIVRNCSVYNPNAAQKGVQFNVGSASPPAFGIHLVIDGFTYTGSTLAGLVSITGTNNVTTTMSGYVTNLSGDGITSFLGASLTANYSVPIRWPGTVPGVAIKGDTSPTLDARVDLQTQLFSTALTADRAVNFTAGTGADGDTFQIVRSAGSTGGPWALSVLGSALAINQQATVKYVGGVAIGTWTLVSVGNRT